VQVVDRLHLVRNLGDALARHSIELQSQRPRRHSSARRVAPDGSACTTRFGRYMPSPWGLPPSRGVSRSVARPSIGISRCLSRRSGNGHVIAGSPSWRPSPRIDDGGGTLAAATPNSSGGSWWPRGIDRRGGPSSGTVGQLRRETGTRFTCRQAAPAPLYAEDQDESRPPPLTALRVARLFLAKPGETGGTTSS
jgi:hypothetical protein